MNRTRILSRLSLAVMMAGVLCVSVSAHGRSVKQKKQAARSQFQNAERMREALEGKPEADRSRRDFQQVMDAYRKVYYTAPTSNKADAAVLAVAELLEEQGRVLNDSKSYKDAIGQLVFLRREYPGSKYRVEALFTIGEIYSEDLNDYVQAKATFEDFLKHYPNSSKVPEARKALAEASDALVGGNPFKEKQKKLAREKQQQEQHKASRRTNPEQGKSAKADETPADSSSPDEKNPKSSETANNASAAPASEAAAADAMTQPQDAGTPKTELAPNHIPRLTGVRYWSTPDYTRVAIDLESEVKYDFGRVPHPDRIFFDLYGTKLAPELVGKSFAVEAGFLHRIRVAQDKANVARVVLDVNDVAEYSAFLLPNPYRLIIDIHGKLPATREAGKQEPSAPVQRAQQTSIQGKDAGTKAAKQNQDSRDPEDSGSDVTVTTVKPQQNAKTSGNAAAAVQRAEASGGPLKKQTVTGTSTEIAKADPPRTVVDDTTLDTPDTTKATTTKPTSGPSYEAVAPRESSRAKRKPSDTASASEPASTTHTAAPTASGERSLIRALGLKIGKIVVDAGHGGHDTGTVGPHGLQEKDLVLDVALRLGKLLEKKMGAEVVYTRDDDTFIPLETRTAIANKEQADLFISIHANSSSDPTARGVETYYLNFTSSRDALEVAARENAVSDKSIHELQDLVKKIALKEKIQESREFAADVEQSLYSGLSAKSPGIHNRGVKKAPFIVLIGANMPSILSEISFVSNSTDEKKLKTPEYRQRIAESLFKGITKYVGGLSGVRVASHLERNENESSAAVASK